MEIGLHLGNNINKEALAIVIQVGQIIGEVCKVISNTHLDIVAEMTINAQ